jgi:hypothetical protein
MAVTPSVNTVNPVSYYGGITPSGTASNTSATSGSSLSTQDSVNLQFNSALLQSMFPQPNTAVAGGVGYPTNIQQAVQNQEILATNPELAQMLTQQASSPLLAPLTAPLETLMATSVAASGSVPSITSLASSMQVLQNMGTAGTLENNPSLAQNVLQNYTTVTNVPSLGSVIDTSA